MRDAEGEYFNQLQQLQEHAAKLEVQLAAAHGHPASVAAPMDIGGGTSVRPVQSASSSLSSSLQARPSLSSMRSLSSGLPSLSFISVLPSAAALDAQPDRAAQDILQDGVDAPAGALQGGNRKQDSGQQGRAANAAAAAEQPAADEVASQHSPSRADTELSALARSAAHAHAPPARYTKPLLRGVLQLMGCKQRHAHKMSERLFSALDVQLAAAVITDGPPPPGTRFRPLADGRWALDAGRAAFERLVGAQLASFGYEQGHHAADLRIACSIQERRESVTVLLCGTSGTGKSTLASLLAARLGVSAILSTDSVRHMLRGFSAQADAPLLWVSTYQAGDCIRDADMVTGSPASDAAAANKRATVKGYKAQSQLVMDSLTNLVAGFESRRESIVIEGVHLAPNAVVRLMAKHPSVVPFLVYISNEAKHRERFAVRAKHMTLDPAGNRYIKYIRNIRAIQEYLVRRADRHSIPKVDNTNVDRSVATIHATLTGALRRREQGEPFLDPHTSTAHMVAAEFAAARGDTWSSKDMLQLIRRKSQGRTPPSLMGMRLSVTMPPLREGQPPAQPSSRPHQAAGHDSSGPGAQDTLLGGSGSAIGFTHELPERVHGTAASPQRQNGHRQQDGSRKQQGRTAECNVQHSAAAQPAKSRLSNCGDSRKGRHAHFEDLDRLSLSQGVASALPDAQGGRRPGGSNAGSSPVSNGSLASNLPPQSPPGSPPAPDVIAAAAAAATIMAPGDQTSQHQRAPHPPLPASALHRRHGHRRAFSFAARSASSASPRLGLDALWGVERSGHSGVSAGGGSSVADTDADLESQHRSADGSESAAIHGWSTEIGSVADSGTEGSDTEGIGIGSAGSGRISSPGT